MLCLFGACLWITRTSSLSLFICISPNQPPSYGPISHSNSTPDRTPIQIPELNSLPAPVTLKLTATQREKEWDKATTQGRRRKWNKVNARYISQSRIDLIPRPPPSLSLGASTTSREWEGRRCFVVYYVFTKWRTPLSAQQLAGHQLWKLAEGGWRKWKSSKGDQFSFLSSSSSSLSWQDKFARTTH